MAQYVHVIPVVILFCQRGASHVEENCFLLESHHYSELFLMVQHVRSLHRLDSDLVPTALNYDHIREVLCSFSF